MLLVTLNLAELFAGFGALAGAERLLETFSRLVQTAIPRCISLEAAGQTIQMAEQLIELLFD